jgi:hypothetical protein
VRAACHFWNGCDTLSLVIAMRSFVRSLVAFSVPLASLAFSHAALAAPTRETCVDSYEQAQVAIKRGELSKARDLVRVCLDSACSSRLQSDCATWLTEIESKQPTIVVSYKDRKGVQRTDVEVFVDGKSVAAQTNGRGIPVDPGPHLVRIVPVGDEPMEEQRVVREGVKLDAVEFSRAPKILATTAPVAPPERPFPVSAIVAGSVGLVGLGSFATFAILGKTAQNNLDNTCVDRCSDSEVATVRQRYLIADISLAVGVVGVTSAVLLYVFRPAVAAGSSDKTNPAADTKSASTWAPLLASERTALGRSTSPRQAALRGWLLRGWFAPDVQVVSGGAVVGWQGTLP